MASNVKTLSIDHQRSPVQVVLDDTAAAKRVKGLAEQWIAERPRGGDLDKMTDTPAYQAVIGLGHQAIRPLLLLLRQKPDHWFVALNRITGENPVPPEAEGNMAMMASVWIKWGNQRGYLGSMD